MYHEIPLLPFVYRDLDPTAHLHITFKRFTNINHCLRAYTCNSGRIRLNELQCGKIKSLHFKTTLQYSRKYLLLLGLHKIRRVIVLVATMEAQDTKYDSKISIDYLDKTFKLKISSSGMENVTYQQYHDFHESLNQSPIECLQEKYSSQQDKLFLHQVFWSLCGVSGFP